MVQCERLRVVVMEPHINRTVAKPAFRNQLRVSLVVGFRLPRYPLPPVAISRHTPHPPLSGTPLCMGGPRSRWRASTLWTDVSCRPVSA